MQSLGIFLLLLFCQERQVLAICSLSFNSVVYVRSLALVSVASLTLAFASILAASRAFLRSICSFNCAADRGRGVQAGTEGSRIGAINGVGAVLVVQCMLQPTGSPPQDMNGFDV